MMEKEKILTINKDNLRSILKTIVALRLQVQQLEGQIRELRLKNLN